MNKEEVITRLEILANEIRTQKLEDAHQAALHSQEIQEEIARFEIALKEYPNFVCEHKDPRDGHVYFFIMLQGLLCVDTQDLDFPPALRLSQYSMDFQDRARNSLVEGVKKFLKLDE